MSTPTPAAQLPTRQQLDEIDALLRRMLSLPPLAAAPGAESPTQGAPAGGGLTYPAPVIREVPPPHPPAAGDPTVQEWRVGWPQPPAQSVTAWGSPVPLATPAEAYPPPTSPAPHYQAPSYLPPGAAPVPAARPPLYSLAAPALPAPRPLSPVYWPLVVLNVTFNVLTYLLGPIGTWLRGPGRALMGWLGIGMIAAAAVWAAGEWYGYDWPKLDLSVVQSKLDLSR